MAIVSVTNAKLKFNKAGDIPAAVAVDATDGARVSFKNKEDARILIILENAASAAKTATVKAGGGLQGVNDLTIQLAASAETAIVLESGPYVQTEGENRGYVVITGTDANVKVAAIELP